MKTYLPINEEKWGSITTTNNEHYIISFNVLNNRYYLYIETESGTIEKITSSTDSVKLLGIISKKGGNAVEQQKTATKSKIS